MIRRRIAGVDEAGRGPWAGPVLVAAVVLPLDHPLATQVDDSKRLSPKKRAGLFHALCTQLEDYAIVAASVEQIEALNILQATLWAMREAVCRLAVPPDAVYIDGDRVPAGLGVPAQAIVQGDSLYPQIAAASILAKVTRDRIMVEADTQYPGYGFARHKGYGTAEHVAALRRLGPCPLHRKNFSPVRRAIEERAQYNRSTSGETVHLLTGDIPL